MSELEDQLNSILSDPKQMEKIAGLARSLMGGEDQETPPAAPPGEPGLDAGLLQKLGSVMKTGGDGGREQALLRAMEPYLSDKRRVKLDRAMKLARMAKIARLMMGEGGHDQPL